MKTLFKKDVAKILADKHSIPLVEAERRVTSVLDCLMEAVSKGNDVTLTGIMSFKHNVIKSREMVVPGTGERRTVPATRVVNVRVASQFKEKIKELGTEDLD